MSDAPLTAAIAVLPCSDLAASRAFYARLGLNVAADYGDYLILKGHGCELHLNPAVPGWLEAKRNPFRLYLRLENVAAVAAAFEPGAQPPKAQPWGMLEFATSDPDGTLVIVGWPVAPGAR